MTKFKVWCPDRGQGPEHAANIQAIDEFDAAETWAMRSDADSGEYSIVSGHPVTVMVQSDGPPRALTVEGESIPSYNAFEQGPTEQGPT